MHIAMSVSTQPDISQDECAHRNLEHTGGEIFRCDDCGRMLNADELEQLIREVWGANNGKVERAR